MPKQLFLAAALCACAVAARAADPVTIANIYTHAKTKDLVAPGPQGLPIAKAWRLRGNVAKGNTAKVPNSLAAVKRFYTELLSGVEGVTLGHPEGDAKSLTIAWKNAAAQKMKAVVSEDRVGTSIQVGTELEVDGIVITGRPARPSVQIIIERDSKSLEELFGVEAWWAERMKDYPQPGAGSIVAP